MPPLVRLLSVLRWCGSVDFISFGALVTPIVCYMGIVICPFCGVASLLVFQAFCYGACCFTLIVSLMPYGCSVLCLFLMVI